MSSRIIQDPETNVWAFIDSVEVKHLFLILAVSVAIMTPAIVFGVPSNRDLANHFRFALPFYDAIANGNFNPGWLAESNSGYGDPSFRFYPPALYYLLAAIRFLCGNWYVATLLTFTLISVASGFGLYLWAKSILPPSAAICASLFFALTPYHVNQLYQATMLAEWAGSAVLPFVFAFVERVCARGNRQDIAGLAAAYALLLLTHLPLAVIGSLALLVYALVRIKRQDLLQTVKKLSLGAALGLCASAVYWVTMVAEVGWIGLNEVERDASVDYRFNFILSTLSPDNLNVWWMNILALMTLLLCAPAFLLLRRGLSQRRRSSRPVIVLTGFAFLMSLPVSRPIWLLLPPLQQTQFPWRWLALVSMGGSILAAAALPFLAGPGNYERGKRLLILGAMAISVTFTLSHIVREAQYLTRPRFDTELSDVRGSASVNYWFPRWARANPRPMAEVEASGRDVFVEFWQPEHRRFRLGSGRAGEIRARTFYYPHWTATSGGAILATRPDKDGALLISVPAGAIAVDLDFREPQRTRISALTSLAGFCVIGALAFPVRRRTNL